MISSECRLSCQISRFASIFPNSWKVNWDTIASLHIRCRQPSSKHSTVYSSFFTTIKHKKCFASSQQSMTSETKSSRMSQGRPQKLTSWSRVLLDKSTGPQPAICPYPVKDQSSPRPDPNS